jgi:X-X-X-Leu-X-X-Gly heptad repeat protein
VVPRLDLIRFWEAAGHRLHCPQAPANGLDHDRERVADSRPLAMLVAWAAVQGDGAAVLADGAAVLADGAAVLADGA